MGDIVSMLTQAGWNFGSILVKGGLVMVPLLASSMMALAVILERCLFWRRFRKSEDGATILSLVAAGHLAEATKMARASRHPAARPAGRAGASILSARHGYGGTVQAGVHRLKRYLPMLDTIITLAPLLGLLGTITGMISSFGIVSEADWDNPRHHRWRRGGTHRDRHRARHLS